MSELIKCHSCQKEVDTDKHHFIDKPDLQNNIEFKHFYYHPMCLINSHLDTSLMVFKEKKIKELNEKIKYIKSLEL